jgi:hypothetical protein
MGMAATDAVLDVMLDHIADNGTRICVCSAEPTTYTEAITTYKLAIHTMTVGDGNGDYTITNGVTSGRKLAMTAQVAITVDASGTATHVALADSGNSLLLFVTTCTSQALLATNTVTIPTWDIEILDPAAP